MTVYLVISLPKISYIHRIYTVLANPIHALGQVHFTYMHQVSYTSYMHWAKYTLHMQQAKPGAGKLSFVHSKLVQ